MKAEMIGKNSSEQILTQMRIDTQPWVLMGPYKLC